MPLVAFFPLRPPTTALIGLKSNNYVNRTNLLHNIILVVFRGVHLPTFLLSHVSAYNLSYSFNRAPPRHPGQRHLGLSLGHAPLSVVVELSAESRVGTNLRSPNFDKPDVFTDGFGRSMMPNKVRSEYRCRARPALVAVHEDTLPLADSFVDKRDGGVQMV